MVTTIQEVDILQAYIFGIDGLARALNPTQIIGYDNWQDAIIVWDDTGDLDPQPSHSNADFIAWENGRLSQIAQNESDRQTVIDETESYNLTRTDYVLAYQLENQLASIFANGGSPTSDTLYLGFVTVLNGSTLETGVTNWVTALTGLTGFGVGIPIAEKRQIMVCANGYLQSLCIVGIIKGFIQIV